MTTTPTPTAGEKAMEQQIANLKVELEEAQLKAKWQKECYDRMMSAEDIRIEILDLAKVELAGGTLRTVEELGEIVLAAHEVALSLRPKFDALNEPGNNNEVKP